MNVMDVVRTLRAFGTDKVRDLLIDPPAPQARREGLAVVAIVKNVAGQVEEWIEFHRAAGVVHFVLYDNGSTDGSLDVLRRYQGAGVATVVPWALSARDADTRRRFSAQVTAYAHAVTTFGGAFERMAFIDIDEFMVPKVARSLLQLVVDAGGHANISLPWHMFGHGGHEVPPSGGIVRNYTERARLPYARPDLMLRFKCIVDPCTVTLVSVHDFETTTMGDRTANMRGQIVRNTARRSADFFCSEGIQLNHYYTLSRQEFERKMSRGAVSYATTNKYARRLQARRAEIERATEPDRCAVDFLDRYAAPRHPPSATGDVDAMNATTPTPCPPREPAP